MSPSAAKERNVAPPQGAALVVVEGLYLLDGEGIRLALGQADVFGAAVVEMVVAAIDGVRLRRHVGQPLDLAVGVQQGAEAAALQNKAGVAQPGDGHNGNPPWFISDLIGQVALFLAVKSDAIRAK